MHSTMGAAMAAARSKTNLATIMEMPRNGSSPADSGTSMTDNSDWTSDSSEEEDDDCIIVGYRTIKSPPIQRNSQPKPKPQRKHRFQPYPKSKPQLSHAPNAPLQYPSQLLPQHIPLSLQLPPILDPPVAKIPWRKNYPEPRAVDIWRPVQTTAGALTTYSTPRTEPVNHALSSNSYGTWTKI